MAYTPTQLTLRHLRNEGWPLVEVVEHWNSHARIRQDLFGFIDIIAIARDRTLAIQCTSAGNTASRIRKIAEHPNIGFVREAGWEIRVHGWRKRNGRWELHRNEDLS